MALLFKNKGSSAPPWGASEKAEAALQRGRAHAIMSDGLWHMLAEISEKTGDPEASVSARLREFRKAKYGAFVVDRRRTRDSLHEYRFKT